MQNTSALYKSIVSSEHEFETKLTIAGNEITEDKIFFVRRDASGLVGNRPNVGGAISSTLKITIATPSFSIPRMAEIDVFIRAKNNAQTSEWIRQGIYFIDTRKATNNNDGLDVLTLTAYDAMMKAEQDYPNANHNWPYLDKNVVSEIASAIGVTVDSRTNGFLTSGYMIGLPLGYTMRETLERIATMYCGNFVMSNEGKLLFVPLYGLADELVTGNYLADGSGKALVFGNEGWYILV